MREIKFRAWHKASRKMISWEEMVVEGLNKFFTADYELMQFVGVKDKNAREIYENDIVRYAPYEAITSDTWWVRWNPRNCAFELENESVRYGAMGIYVVQYMMESMEVEGNLFERAESKDRKPRKHILGDRVA